MDPRLLAGRYELHEQLGDASWRATDTELGREVLVRLGPDADVPGATLSHQSIARVYDQGETGGARFAVLEYLPGGSLAERGELAPAAAADLADALAYAHAEGVVHGALEAESIRFDAEGRPKLTGFRGEGDPDADLAALAALAARYEAAPVTAPPPAPVEETTLIQSRPPAPAAPRPGRGALVAGALALALAGIAAAFLAASDEPAAEQHTGSLSVPVPTAGDTTVGGTVAPPPTEATTEEETTATTETPPATTAETEPPPVTAPPVPLPTEPIPTEPVPTVPIPTEPLPPPITTEDLLPSTDPA